MNKSERTAVLRRLKPATWYSFCQFEAMHLDEEVKITKAELAMKLDLSLPTLTKNIQTWISHNLVQEIDGGFSIAQLDRKPSNISEEPIVREFKTAKDIIDYWCIEYEKVYGTRYIVTNWVVAASQVKKLLRYPDDDIRATLTAAVTLYERTWAKPAYPRPTLGQVCSWLYVQAQPYGIREEHTVSQATEAPVCGANLLNELEAKGWL